MSETIERPQTDIKKISTRNDFELCYLRHRYLRKTTANPSKLEMKPYMPIAERQARRTFDVYEHLFSMVGLGIEDLISIANIHLVSFLGLFSLEKTPEKYKTFVALHTNLIDPKIQENQIMDKNKANCTLFMKQRMEDVVRICAQKARNIKGLNTEEYFYYYGAVKPPNVLRDLVSNYEKLGYRKFDHASYRAIRKKVKVGESQVFRFNNLYYVAVPVEEKSLQLSDFTGTVMDPHGNIHNMNPEQALFDIERETTIDKQQEEFLISSDENRASVLRQFIEQHRKNPHYMMELKTAKKMLKRLE